MRTRPHLSANRRSLVMVFDDSSPTGTVDIRVNDHRVWSVPLPALDEAGKVSLRWPAALIPYLRGYADLDVRDSGDGRVVASGTVRFGLSRGRVDLRDPQGRWLSMNKWGTMSPGLEGDSTGVRERLLVRSQTLIEQLVELGYATSITSGTLLGALRHGDILPHDDDVDLAVLLEHSHPSDLSLTSYRLEDELTSLGYTVTRHSTAHLQVTFLQNGGLLDHYIDIFTAFYRGDEFCQPFHIRQVVPRSSVAPTGTMHLAGIPFPAPAVPADWLAACYGADWETPDPSFRFETPLATKRRFDSWFGSQNTNRDFWEAHYGRLDAPETLADGAAAHLRSLSRLLPSGAPVVDVGCGTAALSSVIAANSHDVIGVDYSYRALAIAASSAMERLELRFVNVYDRRRLLEFGAELVRTDRTWHFNLSHVMAGLTVEGRSNLFLLLRLVLTNGAFAFTTEDTNYPVWSFDQQNPETWHLPLERLRAECEPYGLVVDVVATGSRRTPVGRRQTATTMIRLAAPISAPTEGARE